MISGNANLTFLLKLYISLSSSSQGNSNTGITCSQAQKGVQVSLIMATTFKTIRKVYQFLYFTFRFFQKSSLASLISLLVSTNLTININNKIPAMTCQNILMPLTLMTIWSPIFSYQYEKSPSTIRLWCSMNQQYIWQLSANLLSPSLEVMQNLQTERRKSLGESSQNSPKNVMASSTLQNSISPTESLVQTGQMVMMGSYPSSQKCTVPSSAQLLVTLTTPLMRSRMSSQVKNQLYCSSWLSLFQQIPLLSRPSKLRLKYILRFFQCLNMAVLWFQTRIMEVNTSRPISIRCWLWSTPEGLIIFLFMGASYSSVSSEGGVLLRMPSDYSDILIIQITMLTRFRSFFSTNKWHHTTILALKRNQQTVIIGDGQVSYGSTIVKTDAKKIRPLGGGIYCGFAGSVADAFALMEGLEKVMEKYPKQTLKSCIHYAKEWRTGKQLRHLEATLIVVDKDLIIQLDGTGNVIEIEDVIGVGSGGLFAQSAAKALLTHTEMKAEQIARASMKIAADKCIYTSHEWLVEKVE